MISLLQGSERFPIPGCARAATWAAMRCRWIPTRRCQVLSPRPLHDAVGTSALRRLVELRRLLWDAKTRCWFRGAELALVVVGMAHHFGLESQSPPTCRVIARVLKQLSRSRDQVSRSCSRVSRPRHQDVLLTSQRL